MLGVNQVSLFIFLGVYVTRQIKHIISRLIFQFLGDPWPLRLSFEFPLVQNCGLTRTCGFGFALLLLIGISSFGVLVDRFTLSTVESVFFFAVSVPSGYLWQPSFCLLSFSGLSFAFALDLEFWINSNGLEHLGLPLIFTQVTSPPLTHFSFSEKLPQKPKEYFL